MELNADKQSQAPLVAPPATRPPRAKHFIAAKAPPIVRFLIKAAYAIGRKPKARLITENERVFIMYVDLKDRGEIPDDRSPVIAFCERLRRYWLVEGSKEHAWANPHLTPPSLLAKGF